MWSRPYYLGMMVKRNSWTLSVVVVSSHTNRVFVLLGQGCEAHLLDHYKLMSWKYKSRFHVCLHSMCQSAKIILDMNCNRFWPLSLTISSRIAWKIYLEFLDVFSSCQIHIILGCLWEWELPLMVNKQQQVACCQVSWTGTSAFLGLTFP